MAQLIHQNLTEVEKAYLAGLFDGEAFIGLTLLKSDDYYEGRYWAPRVRVHMCSEVTIQRIADLAGGKVRANKLTDKSSQSWAWECPRGEPMVKLLKNIQLYSITKQRAIKLMIAFLEYRYSTTISERRNSGWEEYLAQEIRSLTATTRQIKERRRGEREQLRKEVMVNE